MDYNEYNSNGNKKKFNLSNMMSDKQQRSVLILAFYLVLFIILIIFIRLNINSTSQNKEETIKNNEIENNKEKEEKINIDLTDMFSFIDLNNYNFTFNINMGNSISLIEGKRFNDKYSFTIKNNDELLYFNGTSNYIRAKDSLDGEYKMTGFPYVLVNIFDTNIIKKIINNSTLNNGKYEINNETLGNVIGYDKLTNKDKINTIELVKSNNIVTGINLDFSSSISSYINDEMSVTINLKYSDFGLIEDFKIE